MSETDDDAMHPVNYGRRDDDDESIVYLYLSRYLLLIVILLVIVDDALTIKNIYGTAAGL